VDEVRGIVSSINSYAQIETSSYSKVNLDFVLNTHSYDNDGGATAMDTGFLSCLPCAPSVGAEQGNSSGTASEVTSRRAALRALGGNSSYIETSTSGHIPSDMRTQYLRIAGGFDLRKLNAALDALLYSSTVVVSADAHGATTRGATEIESEREMAIFRMKGLVHIHGEPHLYILQAVHTIFDVQQGQCEVGGAEDTTQGESVFVVIGKYLDMEQIEDKLRSCIAV
jgi:G3E family GTPase